MTVERHNEEIIERLERLGGWEPSSSLSERAVERLRREMISQSALHPARPVWTKQRWAVAAAVILITMSAAALELVQLPASAQAAFSQVQKAIQSTRSITCRYTLTTINHQVSVDHWHFLADGTARTDHPDGSYSLVDEKLNRCFFVDPKQKTATLTFFNEPTPQAHGYNDFLNLKQSPNTLRLPAKKLGGIDVIGFRIPPSPTDEHQTVTTVWANPTTHLPVQVEFAVFSNNHQKYGDVVIDQIEFDAKFDERLFSFEPPAGYRFYKTGESNFIPVARDGEAPALVMTPLQGVGPIKFGMSRAKVEALLEKPDAVEATDKPDHSRLLYKSRGLVFDVAKGAGVVAIACCAQKSMLYPINDFPGTTSEGITLIRTVRTSQAEVVKAYGKPDSQSTEGGSTYFTYNHLQARFLFFGDVLMEMQFRKPR